MKELSGGASKIIQVIAGKTQTTCNLIQTNASGSQLWRGRSVSELGKQKMPAERRKRLTHWKADWEGSTDGESEAMATSGLGRGIASRGAGFTMSGIAKRADAACHRLACRSCSPASCQAASFNLSDSFQGMCARDGSRRLQRMAIVTSASPEAERGGKVRQAETRNRNQMFRVGPTLMWVRINTLCLSSTPSALVTAPEVDAASICYAICYARKRRWSRL